VVICLQRGADCLHMVQLMPLHPKTPSSIASFQSRLVSPFWCRFTQVVVEKRLLNGCSVVVVLLLTENCWVVICFVFMFTKLNCLYVHSTFFLLLWYIVPVAVCVFRECSGSLLAYLTMNTC